MATIGSNTHYDITIIPHKPSNGATPPPTTAQLLYPPRPASPLRHATLTFGFQSADFTDARYQLPALVYEQSYYTTLAERAGSATALSELDGELVGNRLLVERLDYRNVLSVYINSYRIHTTPLAKSRKDALTASPSPAHPHPHTSDESAVVPPILLKPIPLPSYLHSLATAAFLLHSTTPKSSRSFVLLSHDAGAVLRYFGLVNEIMDQPRSDQWLDVPDAARLQSQLRVWEEEKEAEMLRDEEERKPRVAAAKAANGHEAAASSPLFQPVATYLSAGSSSRSSGGRSALLTSSTSTSRSSHLGGIKNLGNSCFAEHDTRVLTDSGFLFLSEVEERIDDGQHVLYACYDTSTQSIVYRPGRLVEADAPTRWVDFTHADTRQMWDTSSDDYGSTVSANVNHLSLRTTPDHDMYVQLCSTPSGEGGYESHQPRLVDGAPIPPHKQPARELAPGYKCDCIIAGQTCTHGYSLYRMYTGAASGLHAPADVISLSDRDPCSPVVALGLRSSDELDAFLELFGYWLGDSGYLSHDINAVCFATADACDRIYLLVLLARLHLERGQHFTSSESDVLFEVRITEPRWLCFFDDEFSVKYSNSLHYDKRQGSWSTASSVSASATCSVSFVFSTRAQRVSASLSKSMDDSTSGDDDLSLPESDPVQDEDDAEAPLKWLPDWSLFRLDAKQLRRVIEGLRRANGSSVADVKAMQIYTSDVGFRDQLIHACLHAGYSAYFSVDTTAGNVRGNRDSWCVSYSDVISELLPAQDVRFDGSGGTQPGDLYDQQRDGRVWCVDVQHDDHLIFVQRAHRNDSGTVTKVGRTMIVGNCYMNAILQALLSIPAFVTALTSPRLISANHELPSPLSPSSFYWHLVSLALLYQQSDHGVLDIGELKEVIGSKRERFAGNTQQDAHEFLSECLNALQDDVIRCVRSSERAEVKVDSMRRSESGDSGESGSSDESSSGGRSSRSPSPLPLPLIRSPSSSSFISSALPRHMQRLIHRLSPIHRTFHCEIEYTLTCTNAACGYTRKNKESCYDLSLDLPDLPAPSNHRLASPIPSAAASPLLSPQYPTSSPSPEHSPTLSPALSPRASPALPPLSLSASDPSPDLITLDPVRSASPSIDTAASPSPPAPIRRRQKASGPPSSSLSSLLSTFFSPRTLICNCAHCFPEVDTRVLTSSGMLFLDQIEERMQAMKKEGKELLFGCYDKESKSLLYRSGQLVFPPPPQELIEFTSEGESARWTEASGSYGTDDELRNDDPHGRHVSLRVTPDHRMFVQTPRKGGRGTRSEAVMRPYGKERAADLLPKCGCSSSQPDCEHCRASVGMLACAETGYVPQSTTRRQAVREALGLDTAQFNDFVELLGFWLRDGSLHYHTAGGRNAGVFSNVKLTDLAWLKDKIHAVGRNATSWRSSPVGDVECLSVTDETRQGAAWFAFFDEEFGGAYQRSHQRTPEVGGTVTPPHWPRRSSVSHRSSSVHSTTSTQYSDEDKAENAEDEETDVEEEETMEDDELPSAVTESVRHLPDWVLLELSAAEMRLLIAGLHRADGSIAADRKTIRTTSTSFRDQLMQALLHCGYSAYSSLLHRAGSIATANVWTVSWSDVRHEDSCMPSLPRRSCITRVKYDAARDGRIWCVDVAHKDHLIIAQRAQRDANGLITKQSRPIITGNCPSTTVTISAAMRQMPAVLILHVKRFLPNLSKGSYDKRSDRVKVETELNINFACKPDTKRPGSVDDERKQDEADNKQAATQQQQPDSSMDVDDDELPLSSVVQRSLLSTVAENGTGHSSSSSPKSNGVHAPVPVRPAKRSVGDEIDLTRSDESDNSPIAMKKNKKNNNQTPTSPPVSPTAASSSATTKRRRAPTSSDTRVTRAMHKKLASASAASPSTATASTTLTTASSPSPPPPAASLPPPPPPPLPPPPVYHLSSIVHHRGAFAYSGHYLTDIARPSTAPAISSGGGGAWTRYDDQFVKDVSCEHSLRQAESEGYIFFYVYGGAGSGGGGGGMVG